MAEVVAAAHPSTPQDVGGAHVLPPPDELAHEALEAGQRDVLPGVQGVGQHVARVEQPDVEARRQQRVEDEGVLRGDGVLVGAELGEALLEELPQPRSRLGVGRRPGERVRVTGVVGERPLHPGDRVLHLGVPGARAGALDRGHRVPLRQLLAVVLVEGPPAPDRLSGDGHQHVEARALPGVEVLHPGPATPRTGAAVEVLGEVVARAQEVRRLQPLVDHRVEVALEPVVHHVVRRHVHVPRAGQPREDPVEGGPRGGAPVGVDPLDGVPRLLEPAAEPAHRGAV